MLDMKKRFFFRFKIPFSVFSACYPLDRALDVLVILDGSGSVGGGTFDIQIRMLRKIVDALEFGNDKAKLAVLQYSGYTKVEFNFNEYIVSWTS